MQEICKAFKLLGYKETREEGMRETISPSILRHHTELCHRSTIKRYLEPYLEKVFTCVNYHYEIAAFSSGQFPLLG
jgi:hypothetical protein